MRKTIGKMSKSRGTWGDIKPVTKVKNSAKAYNRSKAKKEWKRHNG